MTQWVVLWRGRWRVEDLNNKCTWKHQQQSQSVACIQLYPAWHLSPHVWGKRGPTRRYFLRTFIEIFHNEFLTYRSLLLENFPHKLALILQDLQQPELIEPHVLSWAPTVKLSRKMKEKKLNISGKFVHFTRITGLSLIDSMMYSAFVLCLGRRWQTARWNVRQRLTCGYI